ncbi:unnamed protein product [Arctia plantaginis]|uniref:Integrase zinc-binding domain-containing protein n=1 Tax=Arctia plantaginis TaxID=874455 RepID=A0A8S1ALA1_ARCPL|nr:unnamed protein product [Arctia plantaginis]
MQMRDRFLYEIYQSENRKSSHYKVLTREKYINLIEQVEEAELAEKKTPMQYRRLKRFGVINIGNEKKLVARGDGNLRYFLPADELFDVIDGIHDAIGHAGRDKMLAEATQSFANITKEMVCLYLSMCEICHQRKVKKSSF